MTAQDRVKTMEDRGIPRMTIVIFALTKRLRYGILYTNAPTSFLKAVSP
jgi:hypothetical protein